MSLIPQPNELRTEDADELLSAMYRVPDTAVPELREPLIDLLDHTDPDIREAAIQILVMRWKDPIVRPAAFRLLATDRADEVREAAAIAVGASSGPDTVEGDIEALIQVLRDGTEHANVRGAAYDALLIIHRRGDFPTKSRRFDPALDVDWDWVETLNGGSR